MKKIAFITVTNEQRKVFDSMTFEQRELVLDIMTLATEYIYDKKQTR